MARGRSKKSAQKKTKAPTKANLPQKVCVVCDRPFSWRKKWETCWDEVKYCSERCRRRRSSVDISRSDALSDRTLRDD